MEGPISFVRSWWKKRQRKIDLEILWPICLAKTENYNDAEFAFMLHAVNDSAWDDLSTKEILTILAENTVDKAGFKDA